MLRDRERGREREREDWREREREGCINFCHLGWEKMGERAHSQEPRKPAGAWKH